MPGDIFKNSDKGSEPITEEKILKVMAHLINQGTMKPQQYYEHHALPRKYPDLRSYRAKLFYADGFPYDDKVIEVAAQNGQPPREIVMAVAPNNYGRWDEDPNPNAMITITQIAFKLRGFDRRHGAYQYVMEQSH